MANTSVTLTNLDFESARNSLKQYLKSQNRFKDIDFEGSNIGVLLDVLAYNTHQMAFYTNMVANEMFMDSALLRDSVVSHAKDLNYVPRSFRSAEAKIRLNITTYDLDKRSLLIPKGTTFTSRLGMKNFTFSVAENIVITDITAGVNKNTFNSGTITIYEGDYVTDSFTVVPNSQNRFLLTNKNVDTSSLFVTVIEDNGSNNILYTRANSLFDIDENSKVFFIQGAENESYEVFFGDGVSGRKPKDYSTFIAEYRVCNGELPNGCNKFTNDGSIDGETEISIEVVSAASSGAISESIESIKYNAPRHFNTQERAITTEDYESLLKRDYPEINTVTAYGGEDLYPPQYGKVFVSIDLNDVDGLPDSKKIEYYNFLKPRSPLSIDPVFVDPEYLYLDIVSRIKYNINVTSLNAEDLNTLVVSAILTFAQNNLNRFRGTLRYSKLIKSIDDTNTSIVSNDTDVRLIKYHVPLLATKQQINFNYKTELRGYPQNQISDYNTFESSSFVYQGKNCYLEDDGQGKIRLISGNQFSNDVGTIDYVTGEVSMAEVQIDSYQGPYIKFYAVTKNKDITSNKNVILNVNESDIRLAIEAIRE